MDIEFNREARIAELRELRKEKRKDDDDLEPEEADELEVLVAEQKKENREYDKKRKADHKQELAKALEDFANADIVWCYPPEYEFTAFYFVDKDFGISLLSIDSDHDCDHRTSANYYQTPRPAMDTVEQDKWCPRSFSAISSETIPPRITYENKIVIHEPAAITTPTTYSADKHPALVYLASLGTSSRRPMGQSLNAIASILGFTDFLAVPWGALRYEHTQAIRSQLSERYSATTSNRHLSALRGVLKDAWRLGYMSAEDYQRAIDLKPVKGEKVKQAESGRHLASGEIKGLIEVCNDGTKAGWRDGAIIAVGYGCGLRRSEIADLELADYDQDNSSLMVRSGKGNKERVAYLPGGAVAALVGWLAVRGDAPGPLFYSIRRGDHVESKGLTDQAIYNILASRGAAAGVKAFTPHDLRRTFAGDLLDAGEDISTVQKMMGHSNVNTTAGYDRRDAKAKKRAASKLHVPYRGQLI